MQYISLMLQLQSQIGVFPFFFSDTVTRMPIPFHNIRVRQGGKVPAHESPLNLRFDPQHLRTLVSQVIVQLFNRK